MVDCNPIFWDLYTCMAVSQRLPRMCTLPYPSRKPRGILLSKEAYQGRLIAGRDLVYLTDQDRLIALRMGDGTQAWQAALEVERQNGCDECLRLIGDHVIVLEKSGGIRTVIEDKEYKLRPLAVRDGTLIVLAAPDWDSRRQALWGLDAATGERRWQEPLQAHELHQGSSSGDWVWQLTPQGLVVAQVLRDEARLIVATLNPRTGASTSKQETELAGLHMPSLFRALWTDDTAWLKLDNKVYAIDLATGKTAYQI
jgi:outer membrane protein assembly factor BamB